MGIYVGDKRYAPYIGDKRRRYMGGKSLPYDYEVEYLESTGTQWINTDVYAHDTIGIELKVIPSTSLQDIPVFGSNSSMYGAGGGSYHVTPYNRRWYYGNNVAERSGGVYSPVPDVEYLIRYNLDNSFSVNGSIISTSLGIASRDYEINISRRKGNSSGKYGRWKYVYIKIYDSGTIVRDFIPVRKGTTGYLYDKVSGQLFGNDGTGSFVLGPDKT